MNKIAYIIFCLIGSVLFYSCSHAPENEAIITGKLNDGKGEKLVLTELDTKIVKRIDSVICDAGGSFRFRVKLPEPGFYMLHALSRKVLVLMLHPGDTVKVSGSFSSFPDHVMIEGPDETRWLADFFRFTRGQERKVDSLEMLLVEKQDSSGYFELTEKLDTVFKSIWERQREEEKRFIDQHPNSMASLIVLNYAFGLNTVLNPDDDFPWFEKLDSALTLSYPENKHVKYHHQRMLEIKKKRSRIFL